MPQNLRERVKDRLRRLFGRRDATPEDPNAMSPSEKLVLLILLDALRANASEIRIVFGSDWTDMPYMLTRGLVERCSVSYVVDGVRREAMCPPGRLSGQIFECVMKRVARDYHPNSDVEDPNEFTFVPPPRAVSDTGPPIHTTTFRVELATEHGAAVLILRPI